MKRNLLILSLLALTACGAHYNKDDSQRLVSVSIVDRNGFNETISAEDRLKKYSSVNFLQNNPYEKVTRVFGRDPQGNVSAIITSYHPNGQPKQYLEVVNGRALGAYIEWHPNGEQKLCANIVGGIGDIEAGAESSWLFDGISQAWDEKGNLLVEIPYQKGIMEGISVYYHDNGKRWKEVPYHNNQINGLVKVYRDDGSLLQSAEFSQGLTHGATLRYWNETQLASREQFSEGKLISGEYYDFNGKRLGGVENGKGEKILFSRNHIAEIQTIQDGQQHGIIKVYADNGSLERSYNSINGIKNGDEIIYYEKDGRPKISISWQNGIIQGIVKTWYPNGSQESQREFSQNKKNGLSTAWYPDGSVMLIEEYEKDLLLTGKYYRKKEKQPISTVRKGEGTATIFNSAGEQINSVTYREGKPLA